MPVKNPTRRKSSLKPYRGGARPTSAKQRRDWNRALKKERQEDSRKHREYLSKLNPPKLKELNKSTGWMKATSVKIRRNKGEYEVLIRRSKPRRKAATKRPARRKTTRRRR